MNDIQEQQEKKPVTVVGNIKRIWTDTDHSGQIRLFASARCIYPLDETFVQLDTVLGITVEFEVICATEDEVILRAKACVPLSDQPSALPVLARRFQWPDSGRTKHD